MVRVRLSRRRFYRQASLVGERFTPGWIATIVMVVLCAIWLGFFSYKYVEYSNDLWWMFSFGSEGEASRFLRAMVGALGVALFFGVAKLLRPASFEPTLPDVSELEQVRTLATAFPRTYAHLALLGDKALLFNSARDAFLMYGVEGRTWVAMGDPVAPREEERRELAWQFRELCERHQATISYARTGREFAGQVVLGNEFCVRFARADTNGKPTRPDVRSKQPT